MKFALMVNSSPYASQGVSSAYGFAAAALAQGHEVLRIFFFGDGVYNALCHARTPADDSPFAQRWQALVDAHGVDLVVCSAAAERRGVLAMSENESGEYASIAPFRVAGLGLWMDACLAADRVLVFHG